MLKISMLLMILCSQFTLVATHANTVHHPTPKDPLYVSKDLYTTLKKALPLPPKMGSSAQKRDEKTLTDLQNTRRPENCEAAKNEVFVSLKSFYGKPHGPLDEGRLTKLSPFFEQVRNDADYFIQRLKKDFPRQRPFLYMASLTPCVPREVTGAYPSGHAVLSKLFALILADFDSKTRDQLETRSIEIGKHRVLSGMHHPSDVEAGRALALLIYDELKKSQKYQEDFAQAFKTLAQ
ncbi:MAG: phosphatase PAP2 family protein [Bdellovibrionota bacterium]